MRLSDVHVSMTIAEVRSTTRHNHHVVTSIFHVLFQAVFTIVKTLNIHSMQHIHIEENLGKDTE